MILAWSYVAAWAQNSWVLWVLGAALWLQTIRRLHDLGRTGWWVAAIMAGEIALLALPGTYPDAAWAYWLTALFPAACFLLIAVLPGQRDPNRFGSPAGLRITAKASA